MEYAAGHMQAREAEDKDQAAEAMVSEDTWTTARVWHVSWPWFFLNALKCGKSQNKTGYFPKVKSTGLAATEPAV